MIKTLLKEVKQYKSASIQSIIFTALEVVMDILLPIMMARIIDDGISAGNLNHVLVYGAIMVGMALFALFLGIMSGKSAAHASSGFAANLREAMYANIQTFSFSNIDKYSTAGMVTRLTTDVTNVQNAYQMIIRMCVRAPFMLIFSMAMALLISPSLSMVFVVAVIFLGGILILILKLATKAFDEVFVKYDDLNASVQENVTAIRVVKSFVREDYEINKFKKAIDNVYRMFVKAELLVCANNPVMMAAVYGCILSLSWLGAHMIVGGRLTTGQLTSLFSYVMSIMIALMMLSMAFVMISMSQSSAERIAQILNEKSDLASGTDNIMTVKDGSIDFNHVNFSYKKGSGKFVLSDIDLHIKPGEVIGIIGGTGSSKTSLVSLISRLYDVTDGEVLVGGVDVRRYNLEALRNQVSVVLQKNELFSGTIYDNLRWGDEKASDDECKRVCRLACADEFIEKFPDGYNTWIEQGGSNVSGGQKQRLCIARALLKKPKVLILDDSTSAVDTATDSKIRKALRDEIPDTTKIIIAQRITSVKEADRILVLDDGRISGFDTHENLLKTNEIYKAVAEGQQEGTGDFDKAGE